MTQHHSDSERSQTLRALDELIARSNDPTPATVAAGILASMEALDGTLRDIVESEDMDTTTKHMAMHAAVGEFARQAHECLPAWTALLKFELSMQRIRQAFPSEAAREAEEGRQSSLGRLILSLAERTA